MAHVYSRAYSSTAIVLEYCGNDGHAAEAAICPPPALTAFIYFSELNKKKPHKHHKNHKNKNNNPQWREETWTEIVPCDWHRWCAEINGFDCAQVLRGSEVVESPNGPPSRWRTGWPASDGASSLHGDGDDDDVRSLLANSEGRVPGGCFPMELNLGDDTPFS